MQFPVTQCEIITVPINTHLPPIEYGAAADFPCALLRRECRTCTTLSLLLSKQPVGAMIK